MKILALNGGGTSGYMTSYFLAQLEKEVGPLCKAFDLVSGVSTGSIIAVAIGLGIPAADICNFYKKMIPEIFRPTWKPWQAKYDNKVLHQKLTSVFGDKLMTDMQTKVSVYAVEISKQISTVFWKSWRPTDGVRAADAATASSSAPLYFAPWNVKGDVFVDGSVSTVNPSMCALADAVHLNNGLIADLQVINVQCGRPSGFDKAEHIRSIFQWYNKIATVMLTSGDETSQYQASALLGNENHAISPSLTLPIDSQDLSAMESMATKMWETNKEELISRWKKQ